MKIKFLILLVFLFLINIVLASEKCPFTVEGKKAYITNDTDECIIQTNEGDVLKINLTICDKIKFRAWSQILDNNGPPLTSFQLVNFRYPSVEIQDTIAILNKDGRFITVTYIAHFDCLISKTTNNSFLKIKVYSYPKGEISEPSPPPLPQPENKKPKWKSNTDFFVIENL